MSQSSGTRRRSSCAAERRREDLQLRFDMLQDENTWLNQTAAAKEAAVNRAEQDALAADRALAKAACAAAQFALELNSTWQGNSDQDKREFAERFAAMEKARDAAVEEGRVALADLRRQHDDAMTTLRREADERETAASADCIVRVVTGQRAHLSS